MMIMPSNFGASSHKWIYVYMHTYTQRKRERERERLRIRRRVSGFQGSVLSNLLPFCFWAQDLPVSGCNGGLFEVAVACQLSATGTSTKVFEQIKAGRLDFGLTSMC